MKRTGLLLICMLISTLTFSQQQKYDFSKEIDEQLWESFVKSYNARDGKSHIKIHTEDVLRITRNGIRKGKAYQDQILESYGRKGQAKREIEFKHEHRIHAPNIAYELSLIHI